jgi:hypothetical protein
MSTPTIGSIVRVKDIDSVKRTKTNAPSYDANFRSNFHKVAILTEVTGIVSGIKDGKYFVKLGEYKNKEFVPSDETRDFPISYMMRFAKVIG